MQFLELSHNSHVAPKDYSFDIVSRVNMQEVRNAMNSAIKEFANRYDFKNTKSDILFEDDVITLIADDDFRMDQIKDIVVTKLLRRGIDMRQIDYSKAEAGTGATIRQRVEFKTGIPQDEGKKLAKQIKDKGFKVTAQVQGEELRVSSKDKDELQKTIKFVQSLELPFPVEFTNYR